jgi:hypothetical protein
MAKKTLLTLIIVFVAAASCLCQVEGASGITKTVSAVTPTASDLTNTITAAVALTTTAAMLNDTGYVTATVTAATEDEMMKLNVKELHLDITPSFRIELPDTSVDLGLKQKIGDTTLEGSTSYNYIYNSIRYNLNYSLDLYVPVGLSLYDSVDFEQIYQNSKYIQRVKGFGLNIGSPVILSVLKLGAEFKNESTYLAKLDSPLNIDQGLASMIKTWFQFKFKNKINGKDYDMLSLYGDLEKAVPTDYSFYNFLFSNYSANFTYKFEPESIITLRGETGYMMVADVVPLWKIYSLGGFDSLVGYPINEFQDFYKIITHVRYDQELFDNINWETWWIRFDRLKFFVMGDCGRVGNVYQVQQFSGYKYGVAAGISLDITFRKRTPLRATLAIGQALYSGLPPVVYFVYELL